MPHLIVIVGPSGAGKSTLENTFKTKRGYGKCISTTTRAIRPGEIDGVDYHYVSLETFEDMVSRNEMVETGFFGGQYYGLSKDSLNEAARNGNGVAVLVAEINGWMTIRAKMGHSYDGWRDTTGEKAAYNHWTTTGIFLYARYGIAASRLATRGDLFGEKLAARIAHIPTENKNLDQFLNSPICRVLYEPTLKQCDRFVELYDPSTAVKIPAKLPRSKFVQRS